MRKGENKSKEQKILQDNCNHRVIMPLHIPNELDYYSQAFEIFEMAILSLKKTSSYNYKLSIIGDNCCEAVNVKLHQLFLEDTIDELILENHNIGKINAILKVLNTVNEDFVTITDADVLFLSDWDEEIFKIFKNFPKAAVVSPTPVFRKQMSYTANIWVDNFFSKKLQFRKVKNPDALEKFAQSLGWTSLENRFKDVIVTLESHDKSTIAVVGAPHFVATYRKEYLRKRPENNAFFKLGGNSEGQYLDKPPFKADGYRLATYDNYAYHMGNKIDSWLSDEYESLLEKDIKKNINLKPSINPKKLIFKKLIEKLFLKLISNRKYYNYILRKKGLTSEQLKSFWY